MEKYKKDLAEVGEVASNDRINDRHHLDWLYAL